MASFLKRLFGGGGSSVSTPNVGINPYSANPYTTGGVQPVNFGGFKPAPPGFQWGSGTQAGAGMGSANLGGGFVPNFGGVGAMNAVNALGGMRQQDPTGDDAIAEALGYGKPRSGGSKMDRIKSLLTGEKGAAIGGVAQGVGSVLGAYMNRKSNQELTKLEREKFEEDVRRQKEREANAQMLRALLMPTIQKYTP
jgi:hypothetical protein